MAFKLLRFSLPLGIYAAGTVATELTPAGSQGNCTSRSFTVPSWLIEDFATSADAGKTTNLATASFNLLNRATNNSALVTCDNRGALQGKR